MDYAIVLKARGDLLYRGQDFRAALPLFREILGILGPMADAQPGNLMLRGRHAEMILYVGDLLAQLKQKPEARRLYSDGLRILKELADRPAATAQDVSTYADYLIDSPLDELFDAREATATPPAPPPSPILPSRATSTASGWPGSAPEMLAKQLSAGEKALALIPAGSPARKPVEDRLDRYRKALPQKP